MGPVLLFKTRVRYKRPRRVDLNLVLTEVRLSGIGYWGRVCWLVGQP